MVKGFGAFCISFGTTPREARRLAGNRCSSLRSE
jgi:hypothetical protein